MSTGSAVLSVHLRGASRTYHRDDERVPALRAVDLELRAGELVAVVGPSGSGKSTLLLVIGGWETLDEGTVEVATEDGPGSPADLAWDDLAVVPQGLGVLDDLTAEENVLLPARMARPPGADRTAHVAALFASLDLEPLRLARGDEMSLGEQQRVAVARALATRPGLVLADEPSSHQDAGHGAGVFETLRAAADAGAIVVVATHDPAATEFADRVVVMTDGALAERT